MIHTHTIRPRRVLLQRRVSRSFATSTAMSARGKGKTTLTKPSEKKKDVVKKEPKPIQTAFSKALAERFREEPRLFALSALRERTRGPRSLMITPASAKMLNSELVGSTMRHVRESLVFCRKKRSPDGSKMHVSFEPGPVVFGAISLGILPEPFKNLPYTPGALSEVQQEEIRLRYVQFNERMEGGKRSKEKKNTKSVAGEKTRPGKKKASSKKRSTTTAPKKKKK